MTATIPLETSPGVLMSATFSVQITIVDACDTTTLNNFSPQVADMLAYVNLGSDTQTVLATD